MIAKNGNDRVPSLDESYLVRNHHRHIVDSPAQCVGTCSFDHLRIYIMSNRRNLFANHPNLQHTLRTVLRHIVHPRRSNNNTNQAQTNDMDNLPPLEPISALQSTGLPTSSGSSGTEPLSNSSEARRTPQGDNNDVDMLPLETTRAPAIDPAFASFAQPAREADAESMPSLQSVSDSSSDGSADVVEMLQAAEDDNDPNWVDDDIDDLPPLEPIAGNRRARVEDDEDDDRDRRHPTQRTNGSQPQNQQTGNVPPFFAGINDPPMGPGARPDMLGLFQMFMGGAGPPPGAARAADTGENGNNQNADPDDQPPFQFTFDIGDGPRPPWNNFNNGALPPGLAELLFPEMTPEQRANPMLQFQAVMERLGAIGQAFGFSMEEEKEDPERAKKLVAGLEVVPTGLVRRMEKVGGAPGGHVDDSTGEVEVPGCAICWDKLLDTEGGGFKVTENDVTENENSHDDETVDQPAIGDEAPSTDEQPSTAAEPLPEYSSDPATPVITPSPLPAIDQSSTVSAGPTEKEEPMIVSLPCAHVFHASCLIPWFSRPRQTTCPTCRFDIDPENLTYIHRPRAQPQPQPTGAAPAPTSAPAGADAEGDASATASANIPPNHVPNAGAETADGRQAFTAMFGANLNGPLEFMTVPPTTDGAADPGRDFAAGMFGPFFGAMRADGVPGAPQGARAPPPAANPTGNMGGAPRPVWAGGVGNFENAPGMVTFDVTLVTNAPFDALGGGNTRRQTHVFANQFFGGNAGPAGPGFPPFAFGPGGPPPVPGAGPIPTRRGSRMPQAREPKQWTPPPAPGPTLRSRVEQREREVGLRCFDTSCGVGPSDEDPFPETSDASMKQLLIRPLPNSITLGTSVCSHAFHPACLVSAERVAGWGGEDKKEQQVEVSCPNCRAVGCVERSEWEEGVRALV